MVQKTPRYTHSPLLLITFMSREHLKYSNCPYFPYPHNPPSLIVYGTLKKDRVDEERNQRRLIGPASACK